VKERVLPDLDDDLAALVSEFTTLADLRDDLLERGGRIRRAQAAAMVRERAGEEIAALVLDDVPDALVDAELQQRLSDLSMRLQAQGIDLSTWLAMQNRDPQEFLAELRVAAGGAARLDLALRAIAVAEGIETTDEDLEAEWISVAERVGVEVDQVRSRFADSDQVGEVRVDLAKRRAFDWVVDRLTVKTEDGSTIDLASLEPPETDTVIADDATGADDEAKDADD
jgi:trigger factor